MVIGASSFLRKYSHGKDITYIIKTAVEVIEYVKSKGLEVRFSSEDSFRSDLVDLLSIYRAVDKIGVGRVGIADTVGCANPRQVYDLVRTLRGVVSCDIECHFHDDSGCGESCSCDEEEQELMCASLSRRQRLLRPRGGSHPYRYLCSRNRRA